jgi:alpha-L-rhamnosidase
MMPDRTIPDNGMNSFNHYSYGAIGDWLYRDAVGLRESSPGFKTIEVKPHPGADFTQMRASQMTPYGRAVAQWRKTEGEFTLDVEIPVNTTAKIYVPAMAQGDVATPQAALVKALGEKDGYVVFEVGSGSYTFVSK